MSPEKIAIAVAVSGFVGGSFGGGSVFFVAVEQRIALEFGIDEFIEFEIGELQQLDRLLQLRRHDELLALAEL